MKKIVLPLLININNMKKIIALVSIVLLAVRVKKLHQHQITLVKPMWMGRN